MKIVHLSDLHFGTETNGVVDTLTRGIKRVAPDLVVISGDFTQVANGREFRRARNFIQNLPAPVFCVPGNHDIPRYDLWERFFNPYKKYKSYIESNLCPVFENDQTVVAGLNSARRALPHWNWANGSISQAQLDHLRHIYNASKAKWRVCVFHHPVHEVLAQPIDTVVFGAKRALDTLKALKVDLVLTGHVHHASVSTLGDGNHKTVYLSASTALSSRVREQENGFNVIQLGHNALDIEMFGYDGEEFIGKEKYTQKLS